MSDFKLPLYVRKLQRDFTPKRDASLAALGALLGGEWTLSADFNSDVAAIFSYFKDGDSYTDSNREKFALGLVELYYDHALAAVVRNLSTIAEDELSKETLEETLAKKTVQFSLDIEGSPKGKPGNPMKIEDGVLTWVVDRGDVGNMHGQYDFFTEDLAKNVEKLL